MSLTFTQLKNAKPREKIYRMTDGRGLYAEITPKGGKYWRFKYSFGGKEKRLAIGVFPTVSIAEAREQRDLAKRLLHEGKDPSIVKQQRKLEAVANHQCTFHDLAKEWHEANRKRWAEKYSANLWSRLSNDIFPQIGTLPVNSITPQILLAAIRKIEQRGVHETASRLLQACSAIFRYGVATGVAERDVSADLKGALQKKPKVQHHKSLKLEEIPAFVQKLDSYEGHLLTRLALQFTFLTFARTKEIRLAKWEDICFSRKQWRVQWADMKNDAEHIIPLSEQALSILSKVEDLTGDKPYLFPNSRRPMSPMSENTMLYAVYRMGYHDRTTVHGIRSMASTILNENGFDADAIERQLSHKEKNKVRDAYNNAEYLPERTAMMQWWADYLEQMRVTGDITPPAIVRSW